ncbi:MAG TPA: M23 family metallopeptidase [Allosphingosinicella sp.]|nr:M23 family metallopeptidase [Allosphingosinicella sp.]
MFQTKDLSGATAGGGGQLALELPSLRPPLPRQTFGTKGMPRRSGPFANLDLVVDLGQRIGSRAWFRGFLTCGALCYGIWALNPGFRPIPGPSPAPYDEAQLEAAQAVSLAPMAYGSGTGRRMAPTDAVEALTQSPERPIVDLRATLGRGDGVASVLQRAGVGGAEADHVATLLAGIATDLRPGTTVDIRLGRRPDPSVARPLERLAFRARFDLRVEIVRSGGALELNQIPIRVDETPLRIQGRVGASLYRSARAAGVPARTVEAYIRALNTQVQVPAGIGSGDTFDIIIEHRRAATGEVETGQLLYAGLVRSSGRSLQLMQWTNGEGEAQWFEASGVGRQTGGGMVQPVPGPVSSNYGLRMHPILGYARMHRGMDFRGAYGTPIVAVADGAVARAGWAGGYGNQVRLNHAGGLATSYSHMSRIAVAPGSRVRQGQVIGYIGSTGLSTGPHLHFETYQNGAAINPRSVRFTGRAQLSAGDLAAFRTRLRGLLETPVGAAQAQAQPPARPTGSRTSP